MGGYHHFKPDLEQPGWDKESNADVETQRGNANHSQQNGIHYYSHFMLLWKLFKSQ